MPTYDYKCLACDKIFEVFQKMTDEPLQNCKYCGGNVKRIISGGSGVIFKGSGFYCTDYKRNSPSQKKSKKEKTEQSCEPSSCKECPAGKNNSDG